MKILDKLYFYIFIPLGPDVFLLFDSILRISLKDKLEFIIRKYLFLFSSLVLKSKFNLAKTKIYLWGHYFYTSSKYGLITYQVTLTSTIRELTPLLSKNHSIETVFDVGANVGVFSLSLLKLIEPKTVYCFEPIPQTFQCLEKNTKHLPLIKPYNLGLSNFTGKSFMEFDPSLSTLSKIKKSSGLEVNLTTLQEFVKQHKIDKIDLLKIDVESHESLVLEGCGDFLSKVKYIFMEVTIKDNTNYTISSLLSLLYGQGYNFQLLSFKNATNSSCGEIEYMDLLLENVKFVS